MAVTCNNLLQQMLWCHEGFGKDPGIALIMTQNVIMLMLLPQVTTIQTKLSSQVH